MEKKNNYVFEFESINSKKYLPDLILLSVFMITVLLVYYLSPNGMDIVNFAFQRRVILILGVMFLYLVSRLLMASFMSRGESDIVKIKRKLRNNRLIILIIGIVVFVFIIGLLFSNFTGEFDFFQYIFSWWMVSEGTDLIAQGNVILGIILAVMGFIGVMWAIASMV